MGLLTFIGAIVVIVAAFLTWGSVEVALLGKTEYGGLDLGDLFDNWMGNAAIISLALAAAIIVIEAVNLFKPEVLAKYASILVFLLSLSIIIICAVYAADDSFGKVYAGSILVSETAVGVGCYVAIVGAVISLILSIGQAYNAFKSLIKKN